MDSFGLKRRMEYFRNILKMEELVPSAKIFKQVG